MPNGNGKRTFQLQTFFRLKKEQVEKLRAELQAYIGLSKKQHGLERAVEEMLQGPIV